MCVHILTHTCLMFVKYLTAIPVEPKEMNGSFTECKVLLPTPFFWLSFFFFQRLFFYLFLGGQRETEHERGRGRERGRHRIGNRLQALSHQPRAWRGAWTHGPQDRDLAEVGRLTDCATQVPLFWLSMHSVLLVCHNWWPSCISFFLSTSISDIQSPWVR